MKNFNNYIFEELSAPPPTPPTPPPTPPVPPTTGTTTGTTQGDIDKELVDILTIILCSVGSGTTSGTTTGVTLTEDPCQRQYQVGEDVLYYPFGGQNAWRPYDAKIKQMLSGGLIQVEIHTPLNPNSSGTTSGTTVFAAPCQHIRKRDNNPATKQYQPNQQLWLWDNQQRKHVPIIFVSRSGNRAVVYRADDPQKRQFSPDYRMIREKKDILFDNFNDFLKNNI